MKADEKMSIRSVPLGENKTLFVPLDTDKPYSTALGFFVKNEGCFTSPITIETLLEHMDETTPVVAFNFKTKKSITDLIKFLRMYRDEIYKQPYKGVE